MILKCSRCRNLALDPPARIGDTCGKNGCWGRFEFYAGGIVYKPEVLMLKCDTCGNVYKASPRRHIFGKCGVNNCDGRLDRFWG